MKLVPSSLTELHPHIKIRTSNHVEEIWSLRLHLVLDEIRLLSSKLEPEHCARGLLIV
jgi:hypothetical protein